MSEDRLITVAIYTYEKAQIIKGILENEGIPVVHLAFLQYFR